MKQLLALVPALAAVLISAAALASHPTVLPQPLVSPLILVEGHVFDHRTGAPLRNVEVMALGWLTAVTLDPLEPRLLLTSSDSSYDATIELAPSAPFVLPIGPSAYTDENGFYSLVLRADVFRSLRATCHLAYDPDRALVLPTTSALPVYDLREARRDFYLRTGPKRAPRPRCQRVYYPFSTPVAE